MKKELRDTPVRRKVLAVFTASKKPLSVKDALAKLPGFDMVTVYRTIHTLVAARELKRVDLGGRAALYENVSSHHHHIVCTSCGKIEDFELCRLEKVEKEILSHSKNFAAVSDHSFELFGLCLSCKTK